MGPKTFAAPLNMSKCGRTLGLVTKISKENTMFLNNISKIVASVVQESTPQSAINMQGISEFPAMALNFSQKVTKDITKLIEDILLACVIFMRDKTCLSLTLAVASFVKFRNGDDPLFSSTLFLKLANKCKSLFNMDITKTDDPDLLHLDTHDIDDWDFESPSINTFDVQGFGDYLKQARSGFDKMDEVNNSPILDKLRIFGQFALAHSLFNALGVSYENFNYSAVEAELNTRKFGNKYEMFVCLADTALFMCERGHQVAVTGTLDALYHSESTYLEYFTKVCDLKRIALNLDTAGEEQLDNFTFFGDLNDAIEQGESIYTHAVRLNTSETMNIRKFVNELQMLKDSLITRRAAGKSRKPPYSVMVHGSSGIGKSYIMEIIRHYYGKTHGLSTAEESVYTRNATAKFWDGLTAAVWCLILDDIGYMNPKKASTDESIMELLKINNTVAFVPDQADLSNKGRIPLRIRLLLASTNTKSINARHYLSNPGAAQRRLRIVITPTVLPKYCKVVDGEVTGMLDSDKVRAAALGSGAYSELWTFLIEEAIPHPDPSQPADYRLIHEKADLRTLLLFLKKDSELHDTQQESIRASARAFEDDALCTKCGLPNSLCECINVQGDGIKAIVACSASVAAVSTLAFKYLGGANLLKDLVEVRKTLPVMCKTIQQADTILGVTEKEILPSVGALFEDVQTCRDWTQKTRANVEAIFTKEYWSALGKKAYEFYQTPIIVATSAVILVGLVGLAKSTAKFGAQVQGSVGSTPVPRGDEKPNVWYQDDYTLSSVELSEQCKCTTLKQLTKRVESNLILLHFVVDGVAHVAKGTGLGGRVYMFCTHTLPADGTLVDIISHTKGDTVKDYIWQDYNVRKVEGRDLSFVKFSVLNMKKDIINYFPLDDKFTPQMRGFYVGRGSTGNIVRHPIETIRKHLGHIDALGITTDMFTGIFPEQVTVPGDCGALCVAECSRPVLIGIHVGAKHNRTYMHAVDQKLIKEVIASFDPIGPLPDGHFELQSESARVMLSNELHFKSPLRYTQDGRVQVFGSILGHRPGGKSKVVKTPLNEELTKLGYQTKFGAPMMMGWLPWHNCLKDATRTVTTLDSYLLAQCSAAFLTDIVEGIGLDVIQDVVEVYDDLTTLNGTPGVAYVDAVNFNTSAGSPWNQSKKYYVTDVEPIGQMQHPRVVSKEISDRTKLIEATYCSGKRFNIIMTAHLKDEARKTSKCESGATRVFTGAPFDFSLVTRKYTLSIIRLFQNHRFVTEMCPGTNCHSSDWGKLYRHVTKFGESKIVAGDYKAYDKVMPAEVMIEAFGIIIAICRKSGNYDEQDLLCIRGIMTDICYPVTDFNGDLVQFYDLNSSGHPLTVIINGLVNSLYMRYSYIVLNPQRRVDDFQNNVALLTYGDDNVMGVSDNAPFFNHTSIQTVMANHTITYTMADKESASVPYIHISTVAFLKRYWVYSPDLKDYACPLELDSIEKSLMVWIPSSDLFEHAQTVESVRTALREYFYWGRKTFDHKKIELTKVLKTLGVFEYLVEPLPTFDELVEVWKAH